MSGGMSGLFSGDLDSDAIEEAMEAGVESGDYEVVDEGPPRTYRLTAQGTKAAEAVFARLGVTPEEAMAWMSERLS